MIPDEKVSVNTFSIIGDKLQEQLRSLISDAVDPNDSPPFNMAKQLYKACMNKTLIEERGLEPLFNITDALGGWPVVKGDQWDSKSEWSWTWAVKEFRKVGYSMDYIFDFSIGIDLKKSTSRIIDVSLDLIPRYSFVNLIDQDLKEQKKIIKFIDHAIFVKETKQQTN